MAGVNIPRELVEELRRQARFRSKIEEAVARVERQQSIESALRYLDCIRGGSTPDECLGIYRLSPKPAPRLRSELKATLSPSEYKLLSKAWRS